jgi:hypothetical protein
MIVTGPVSADQPMRAADIGRFVQEAIVAEREFYLRELAERDTRIANCEAMVTDL